MAIGDWGPGSRLSPNLINIVFEADGTVGHVGLGYTVFTPSGKQVHGGWTWTPTSAEKSQFSALLYGLLKQAAAAEGLPIAFRPYMASSL